LGLRLGSRRLGGRHWGGFSGRRGRRCLDGGGGLVGNGYGCDALLRRLVVGRSGGLDVRRGPVLLLFSQFGGFSLSGITRETGTARAPLEPLTNDFASQVRWGLSSLLRDRWPQATIFCCPASWAGRV